MANVQICLPKILSQWNDGDELFVLVCVCVCTVRVRIRLRMERSTPFLESFPHLEMLFFFYICLLLFFFYKWYSSCSSSIRFFNSFGLSLIPCQWFIWLEIRHERGECAGMNLLRHLLPAARMARGDNPRVCSPLCARKYIESRAAMHRDQPVSHFKVKKSFCRSWISADFCSSCAAAVVHKKFFAFLVPFWPKPFSSWTF